MCLVGYQNDNSVPGGGYFILRNSWGTSWGYDCPYGAGNGTIPYKYIEEYCWEAWTAKPKLEVYEEIVIGEEVSDSLSGDHDSKCYKIHIGEKLIVTLDGPSESDFDLYLKEGSPPTLEDYCDRGYTPTSKETVTCKITKPGDYYIMVRSYRGSGNYKLKAIIQ